MKGGGNGQYPYAARSGLASIKAEGSHKSPCGRSRGWYIYHRLYQLTIHSCKEASLHPPQKQNTLLITTLPLPLYSYTSESTCMYLMYDKETLGGHLSLCNQIKSNQTNHISQNFHSFFFFPLTLLHPPPSSSPPSSSPPFPSLPFPFLPFPSLSLSLSLPRERTYSPPPLPPQRESSL